MINVGPMIHGGKTSLPLFAKPDDTGSSNPDPTMKKGPGSPKGENMPPSGGESMVPQDSKHPHVSPDQGPDDDGPSDT